MAKKVEKSAKFQCIGMSAKPGAELASLGINMQKFCQEFNAITKDREGEIVPVVMDIFLDKSFSFVLKTSPVSFLIKKKLNLKKGASKPGSEQVGSVSLADITEIARYKLTDLNTNSLEQAIKIVSGTVRSMGLKIKDTDAGVKSNKADTQKEVDTLAKVTEQVSKSKNS